VGKCRVPPVPQAAHRVETIALQSVCCIARCFISDISKIHMIEPSLMIDLHNVPLGLFLLPDGNQNKLVSANLKSYGLLMKRIYITFCACTNVCAHTHT
jgi:hypothetical protein